MRNGKTRLVPIVILIDGQYFDAGAYKAAPVPMALWGDTVYEGVKTGVSQGLFTVKSALENPETHEWLGEGVWTSASEIKQKTVRKEASPIPRGMNDEEGPPVLRHAGATKPKAPDAAPVTPPAQPSPPPAAPPAPVPTPTTDQANVAPPATAPQPDKDIPTLKRGKPAPKPEEPLETAAVPSSNAAKKGVASKLASPAPAQVFPAISSEGGPEPHPYTYSLKPEEEQQFRKQMLAMASDEVRSRDKLLAGQTIQSPVAAKTPPARKPGAKASQLDFTDVQMQVFDLNSSNEPVLILSANARLPQTPKNAEGDRQYIVTIVAREDVNTDWHKVFASVTDSSHLDVIPRMELIDAVDVDGDGRGELLFREVFDGGTAYVVYRVIGNELYPLFQGTPAS